MGGLFDLLMKKLILLSILLFSLKAYSQEGTIRVKKPDTTAQTSTGCDFELIADSSLIDKACKISRVSIAGINSSDLNEFRKVLTYYPFLEEILVSKKTFETDLKDFCDTKEYKLEKVEVKGKNPNNIFIDI